MEGHRLDDAGAPVIERVAGKVAQLERMVEYREGRLSASEHGGGGHFLKSEVSALRAGIAALRFHRAQVEGLDDVVLALQGLVDAHRKGDAVEGAAALGRAEKVLQEWEERL